LGSSQLKFGDRLTAIRRTVWIVGAIFALALLNGGVFAAMSDPIVASNDSKVYHTNPRCNSYKKIGASNRVEFHTREEAEASGRRLCKSCERLERGAKAGTAKQERQPPKATTRPAASEPAESGSMVRVKEVLTGGSIILENDERVSLFGVQTPLEGQEMAADAAKFAAGKLKGRAVRFIRREGPDGRPVRDRFGRQMGTVRIEGDSADVGCLLLAEGLAWIDWDVAAVGQELQSKQAEALARGRGIWKRLDGATGNLGVLIGSFSKQYHPPDCAHQAHLTAPRRVTLNEAKAGRLTPCEYFRLAAEVTKNEMPCEDSHTHNGEKDSK